MSTAGRANEVGSVFRCFAATHLAVHALRGRAILGLDLPAGVHTVNLAFETSDPTDDLVVTMSDGRQAYVSAKRQLSRGAPLTDTVAGWGAQAASLDPDDLLVVACEELVGPLRHLDRVLRRRREGLALTSERERSCLGVLSAALSGVVPIHQVPALIDRVRLLHLPGATTGSQGRDLLAALLDAAVPDGKGDRALAVLSDLFHRRAGEAHVSGVDEWVALLEDAGAPLGVDGRGESLSRSAARLAAARRYRAGLAAAAGRIDLSLLADDLEPVVVDGLVGSLMVEAEGTSLPGSLMRYLRRWRRMLVVGQPGAGKSVAVREVAAACAADPDAPVPVLASLPRLLRAGTDGLTSHSLIADAVAHLAVEDQVLVREHLSSELARGRAIILCDSLDECGTRAPWVAQQLADIATTLHPRCAFMVTTRASARNAAARLRLPQVELSPPGDLATTVERVLVQCAEARIGEAQRAQWLEARRAWIAAVKDSHPQLLRVPLMALLVTLVSAAADDADLPRGRATLLHRAVEDSVRIWERRRWTPGPHAQEWAEELSPGILLDGFVVLGHLLDVGSSPTRTEAVAALQRMLGDVDRWALSPSRSGEVAEQVLGFWDGHVAVFVVDPAGRLTARSKVFAEVATAMWVTHQNSVELTRWLDRVLDLTDSDGAIALAAGLDPRVVATLLDAGESGREGAAALVAELAIASTVELGDDDVLRLLRMLADRVAEPQSGREGHEDTGAPRETWRFVELACVLRLPRACHSLRAELVRRARLDPTASTVAAALCALTDADAEERPLTAAGIAVVEAALAIPLPTEPRVVREGRTLVFLDGPKLTPGLDRVAAMASTRLDELAQGSGEAIFHIAMKSDWRTGERIMPALASAGVDTRRRPRGIVGPDVVAWVAQHDNDEATLLDDLTLISRSHERSTDDDHWSVGALSDLMAVTKYAKSGVGEFASAFRHDSAALRRSWLAALADAYGIDKGAVSRQARHLKGLGADPASEARGREAWAVATLDPASKIDLDLGRSQIGSEQLGTLLSCLDASSGWIAWSAGEVLVNVSDPPWNCCDLLAQDRQGQSRRRAALAYLVAILTAGDERATMLERAATSSNADHRYAARLAIEVSAEVDADGSVDRTLRLDPDASVRPFSARSTAPPPQHWSCGVCRHVNNVAAETCAGCDRGTKPDESRGRR